MDNYNVESYGPDKKNLTGDRYFNGVEYVLDYKILNFRNQEGIDNSNFQTDGNGISVVDNPMLPFMNKSLELLDGLERKHTLFFLSNF